MGSTYPRDHVKVARGLLSCALPQVEVNLEEEMSIGKRAAKDSLRVAGKAGATSRYMQIDKNNENGPFEKSSTRQVGDELTRSMLRRGRQGRGGREMVAVEEREACGVDHWRASFFWA